MIQTTIGVGDYVTNVKKAIGICKIVREESAYYALQLSTGEIQQFVKNAPLQWVGFVCPVCQKELHHNDYLTSKPEPFFCQDGCGSKYYSWCDLDENSWPISFHTSEYSIDLERLLDGPEKV